MTEAGRWQDVDNTSLQVNLHSRTTALVTWQLSVQAVRNLSGFPVPAEAAKDLLQVRVTVNGLPYRGSSSYAVTYLQEQAPFFQLSNTFVASLSAGPSSLCLQWKKTGDNVQAWRITAPYYEGTGYSLTVLADDYLLEARQSSQDAFLVTSNVWVDLPDPLQFTLPRDSRVILGYSFTLQPQFSAVLKDRGMEYVLARLVVDGVAFVEGSSSFGAATWNPSVGVLRGYLLLDLAPGPHSLQLQWKRLGAFFNSW